ncbi:MAG: hypothetical protein J6A48_11910 [Clostridia bacterium]|nr:hypothetical protein [Clostridia bacterium]
MQAISLRPQQRLIVSKRIALYALAALSVVFPALGLPFAMLMPLFACPLMRAKKTWIAIFPLLIPGVIAGALQYSYSYALMLWLIPIVPALITLFEKPENIVKANRALVYAVMITVMAGLALWGLYTERDHSGSSLAEFVANHAEQWIMSHPKRITLLYQAMATGLLPVPDGYQQVTLLNLTLDPVFLGEVRMMLRSRVMQLVETQVPSLLVQSGFLIGLFTHLRILRMWGAYLLLNKDKPQKVSVALAPAYSTFRIPPQGHGVLCLCCLLYFVLIGADGFWHRLAQVLYCAFETAYQLQGGAVVCGRIMRKNPDRRVLAGILVAVLYLIAPIALFMIACFENVFSFRSKTEDDKNEREKNEEEEP